MLVCTNTNVERKQKPYGIDNNKDPAQDKALEAFIESWVHESLRVLMTQDAEQIKCLHREMQKKIIFPGHLREVHKRVKQRLTNAQRQWNDLGKTVPGNPSHGR